MRGEAVEAPPTSSCFVPEKPDGSHACRQVGPAPPPSCTSTPAGTPERHVLDRPAARTRPSARAASCQVALASIGWPIWPPIDLAQPCKCHATTTHVTAAVGGVCWHHPRPERLRLELCYLCCRTCASQTIYWDMSSSKRELALGADGGCLVLPQNHSTTTSRLLMRLAYQHTDHHAGASLSFEFPPCASRRDTYDASATQPATSTTAPPCPSPTRHTRGTGRAVAYEAGFVSRVVVVASSSVVCLGLL